MAATDHSRSEAAKQRRQDQLQRWLGSEMDQTDAESRGGGGGSRRSKVRFAQGAVFMAACSAGDQEEVAALLRQGADINHANIDGLTALHQVHKDGGVKFVSLYKRNSQPGGLLLVHPPKLAAEVLQSVCGGEPLTEEKLLENVSESKSTFFFFFFFSSWHPVEPRTRRVDSRLFICFFAGRSRGHFICPST